MYNETPLKSYPDAMSMESLKASRLCHAPGKVAAQRALVLGRGRGRASGLEDTEVDEPRAGVEFAVHGLDKR